MDVSIRWISFALFVGLFAHGCSMCSDPASFGEGDGDAAGEVSGADGEGGGVSEDGSGYADGEAPRCGDAGDCASGEECVEGRCRPVCDGTRCGSNGNQCCTGEEVCIFGGCQTPGKECQNTFQCPDGSYCEQTIGHCIPEAAGSDCTWKPPVGDFTPDPEGQFEGVEVDGEVYNRSIGTPTTADIDDDGLPEIVVVLYRGGLDGALVAAINGENQSLLAYGAVDNIQPNAAGLAVGELDPSTSEDEIVAPKQGGGLIALRYNRQENRLEELWTIDEGGIGEISTESAPAIADLDGNGTAEVIYGFSVVAADGTIWNGLNDGPAGAQRDNAAVTSVVDLDEEPGENGNRDLEIVSGNRALKIDGTELWDASGDVPDGFSAVGDFGNDGVPEVVTVAEGNVYVLNGRDGSVEFGPQEIPGGGEGGPPTIADFDGDDYVEFAAAGEGRYTVYDLDCQGDNPDPERCESESSDGILWDTEVQDLSSSRTGSSVFDFEGDGQAEVVYNDECFLRVYDGSTGDVLFERANTSRTGSEYPIIVDVDKDFNAEIVVVSNNDQIERDQCEENYDNYPDGGTTGVFVYGDANDNWVPTRTIWNEHAYHITNVLEDGTIPAQEQLHYKSDVTNSFRLNVQPGGLFNAPDLVVTSVEMQGALCSDSPAVTVDVTVENQGAIGVGPGVNVAVEGTVGGSDVQIGDVQTTQRLLPGQSETLSITWDISESARSEPFSATATVDPDENVNECREMNNSASKEGDRSEFAEGALQLTSFEVADSACGSTSWQLSMEAAVENDGDDTVPAGVPVRIVAANGSTELEVTTLRTSQPLDPGESTTLSFDWTAESQFRAEIFEMRAILDPEQTAYACSAGEIETEVDCERQG